MPNALAHLPGSDSLLELPKMLADPAQFVRERYEKHGHVFKTRWVVPLAFMIGPEANKTIHVTRRTSFSYKEGYRDTAFGRIFAGSLLTEDGEEHKRDRDILQPAVGRLALQSVCDAVSEIWERAVGQLSAGSSIDAYEFVRSVTFEVSANALLDLGLEEELDEFKPLFQGLVDGVMANVDWRIPFGKVDRGLKARAELVRRLIPRIDAAREREAKGMVGLLAHHREPDGKPLSSERIAEHLLLLFWAGYDTTATTGGWLLHELGQTPEWQERLAAEQKEQLGEGRASMEELEKLTQHGWVLKEIERFRPAVIFFPRRTIDELEFGGHRLPKETFLFYSGWMTHRIKEVFPNPDVFDPGRWDPALGKNVAPSTALVGFGGGPRICLGKAFALMQLRVMLATLLRRFRLAPDPTARMKIVSLPVYRPKDARLLLSRR